MQHLAIHTNEWRRENLLAQRIAISSVQLLCKD
jgi:hypothetical protein